MEFDFVKESEYNFLASDLTEMAKSCKLRVVDPLKPLYKAKEDANSMFFVIQGALVASYKLQSKDRRAIYLNKSHATKNADGVFKSLMVIQKLKQQGLKGVAAESNRGSEGSIYSMSSRGSARSLKSRTSLHS